MKEVSIEFEGLPELIRALKEKAHAPDALRQAFDDIGLDLSSRSKNIAPYNFGKLRGAITYKVDRKMLPTYVVIGTVGSKKPEYAAYMEYGTGLVHDHPSWPKKRHVPPAAALEGWVAAKGRYKGEKRSARKARLERVGADAKRVAFFIGERGGLLPRRYLRKPFEERERQVIERLRRGLRELRLDG